MAGFRTRALHYGVGGSSVDIDPKLADVINGILDRTIPETKRILAEAAKEIATEAAAKWYDQVDHGEDAVRSGDSIVQGLRLPNQTTLEAFVTNDDPNVKYVHRPSANATVTRRATDLEYGQRRRSGMPWREALYIRSRNPKAADGKYLLQELIIKPGKARAKPLAAQLAKAIATGKE